MHYKPRILEEKIAELFGYYPVVAVLGARQVGKSTLVENLFKDKIHTVVFDPVMDMGNARQYPDFFCKTSARPLGAHSAQEINFNQLGREIGVDRKTARAWTDITVATYQWFEIPPFSRNAVKKIAGKRKGYFSDTGFLCYLQRISTPEVIARHPLKGALFETYVVMEIMKNLQPLSMKPNLYHYRSYAGAEVDLILELDGILYPIEIKAKSNPGGQDIKGFRSFREKIA